MAKLGLIPLVLFENTALFPIVLLPAALKIKLSWRRSLASSNEEPKTNSVTALRQVFKVVWDKLNKTSDEKLEARLISAHGLALMLPD